MEIRQKRARQKEHYLFTVLLARKTGPLAPWLPAWDLDYRRALPPAHCYPKGTYQGAEDFINSGEEFEFHPPRIQSPEEWLRFIRESLGEHGAGLVVCGPSVSEKAALTGLPNSWNWRVVRAPVAGARKVELPEAAFDAVVAWDPLSHVSHPWVCALELAKAVRPGGFLFARELATPSFLSGIPDLWRFSSESLRLVYHPISGLTQIFSAFSEPRIVIPAKPEEPVHRLVSTGPCFRWAVAAFRKNSLSSG